jgi:hypothetical protein
MFAWLRRKFFFIDRLCHRLLSHYRTISAQLTNLYASALDLYRRLCRRYQTVRAWLSRAYSSFLSLCRNPYHLFLIIKDRLVKLSTDHWPRLNFRDYVYFLPLPVAGFTPPEGAVDKFIYLLVPWPFGKPEWQVWTIICFLLAYSLIIFLYLFDYCGFLIFLLASAAFLFAAAFLFPPRSETSFCAKFRLNMIYFLSYRTYLIIRPAAHRDNWQPFPDLPGRPSPLFFLDVPARVWQESHQRILILEYLPWTPLDTDQIKTEIMDVTHRFLIRLWGGNWTKAVSSIFTLGKPVFLVLFFLLLGTILAVMFDHPLKCHVFILALIVYIFAGYLLYSAGEKLALIASNSIKPAVWTRYIILRTIHLDGSDAFNPTDFISNIHQAIVTLTAVYSVCGVILASLLRQFKG